MVRKSLEQAKERQVGYYNNGALGAKDRSPLTTGQAVRVKMDDTSEWRKREIERVLPYRSYTVKLEDGTTRRRTFKHVRFPSEPTIVFQDDEPITGHSPVTTGPSQQETISGVPTRPPQTMTRSCRPVIKPARYRD